MLSLQQISNWKIQENGTESLDYFAKQPNYTIAVVAEEAGFSNVRTLQRRIQEAIGMSPVDYRLMLTRDL